MTMLSQELRDDEPFLNVVVKVCDYIDGKKVEGDTLVVGAWHDHALAIKMLRVLNQTGEYPRYDIWKYRRIRCADSGERREE